jgi:head-tail adaptor
VIMRYHPQVTMDTQILFGTRKLFVKGVQNINERGAWMRLHCEEVIP